MYNPITVFMYFLLFPSGKIICIIVETITARIIDFAQVDIAFITLFFLRLSIHHSTIGNFNN